MVGQLSHQSYCHEEGFLQYIELQDRIAPTIAPTQEWNDHLLVVAIREGFSESLRYLISRGADIKKEYEGQSLLMIAANFGKLECARILLDTGADIDWKDVNDYSALFRAATKKHFEVANFLLDRGADPSGQGLSGRHLTHLCLDSPQTLRKALEHFPKPNLEDHFGFPPIFDAVSSFRTEAIEILVEFGADVNITAGCRRTPLTHAVRKCKGRMDAVRCLLAAGADVNHQDYCKSSALHYAETAEMVDFLVEKGADVKMENVSRNTALHCLTRKCSPDPYAIDRLFEHGADINVQNDEGDTPLIWSVRTNNLLVVTYLLSRGANPNIANNSSQTALYYACLAGDTQIVKLLHRAKAQADLQPSSSHSYWTPLHAACVSNSNEQDVLRVIRYLVEVVKVDVNQVYGRDETALHFASHRESSDALKLLTNKNKCDANLEAPNGMGHRPIHLAAVALSDSFQHLLDLGCDIRATDKTGRNALHWAAQGGNVDAVRRILDQPGAVINETDIDGWTALCWAARGAIQRVSYDCNSQERIVKLLLDKGADKSVRALRVRSGPHSP